MRLCNVLLWVKRGGGKCISVCSYARVHACVCTVCSCTESVLAFSMPSELGITVWWEFFVCLFFSHVYDVCKGIYYMYSLYVRDKWWNLKVDSVPLYCWIWSGGWMVGRGGCRSQKFQPGQSFLVHTCNWCKNWTQWLKDTQIKKQNLYL